MVAMKLAINFSDLWSPRVTITGMATILSPVKTRKLNLNTYTSSEEHIRDLVPADDSTTIAVPGLSRFLPDDDETPDEAFDMGDEQSTESHDRSPLPQKVEGRKIDPKRSTVAPVPVDGGGRAMKKKSDEDLGGGSKTGQWWRLRQWNWARTEWEEKGREGTPASSRSRAFRSAIGHLATNVQAGVYTVTVPE